MGKTYIVTFFTLLALSGIGFGIFQASRSPMFTVRVVEVTNQEKDAPLEPNDIVKLAAVPVGKVSLFQLNLSSVEKKIKSNNWIQEVHLQKSFPQTLSIHVKYREPKALIQIKGGKVAYVDADGVSFGAMNLGYHADLPILSGFDEDSRERIANSLKFMDRWKRVDSEISSLHWDAERGFTLMITYKVGKEGVGRATVQMGEEIYNNDVELKVQRLDQVLKYLGRQGIVAKQIWADSSKKIVVKTSSRS